MKKSVSTLYKTTSVREEWEKIWSERNVGSEIAASQVQFSEIASRIFPLLDENDKILEGGCGLGRFLISIMTQGYDIQGIDYVESALRSVKDYAPDARIVVGDVQFLPYPSNTFDLYLSLGVVEHIIAGPEVGLSEAHRVLKNGGLLFITGPCIMTTLPFKVFKAVSNRVSALKTLVPSGIKFEGTTDEFFEYHYTISQMSDFITEAGYRILDRDYFGFKEFLGKIPVFNSTHTRRFKKRHSEIAEAGMVEITLNIMGKIAERVVKYLFPAQFATGWIIVARKKS